MAQQPEAIQALNTSSSSQPQGTHKHHHHSNAAASASAGAVSPLGQVSGGAAGAVRPVSAASIAQSTLGNRLLQ